MVYLAVGLSGIYKPTANSNCQFAVATGSCVTLFVPKVIETKAGGAEYMQPAVRRLIEILEKLVNENENIAAVLEDPEMGVIDLPGGGNKIEDAKMYRERAEQARECLKLVRARFDTAK